MKPSHFRAPRCEREATFWYGGEAYEDPPQHQHRSGWGVALFLAILLAISLLSR
jgi:hypothetical protein